MFQYSKLSVDDELIDSPLIEYSTNNELLLSSLQNPNRPLIILAGSMT